MLSVLLQQRIEYAGDYSSSCSHTVTLEHQQLKPLPPALQSPPPLLQSFPQRMLQAGQGVLPLLPATAALPPARVAIFLPPLPLTPLPRLLCPHRLLCRVR